MTPVEVDCKNCTRMFTLQSPLTNLLDGKIIIITIVFRTGFLTEFVTAKQHTVYTILGLVTHKSSVFWLSLTCNHWFSVFQKTVLVFTPFAFACHLAASSNSKGKITSS